MAGKYYHPNFFDLTDNTGDGNRHRKRLAIIQKHIKPSGNLLDVGCANGLFSFAFGETHSVVGIDYNQERVDSCIERARFHKTDNVDFFRLNVLEERFDTLLRRGWNTIIYLSMHQHIIANHGFEQANLFLHRLSSNCSEMFFDMGQKDEVSLKHNLWWPMLPEQDVKKWMMEYLSHNTSFANIKTIGKVNRWIWHLQ